MKAAINNINISFNGQSVKRDASVSASEAYDLQGSPLGEFNPQLNSSISTSNPEIDKLLKDFKVTEITNTTTPNGKKITAKLVDKLSLSLDSHIVVIKGVHVGPNGGSNYEGYIDEASELPDSLTRIGSGSANPTSTSESGSLNQRIIALGDKYSVLDLKDDDGVSYTNFYKDGVLDSELSDPPNGSIQDDLSGEKGADPSSARAKFSYSLSDLSKAVRQKGFELRGLPTASKLMFEESGRLSNVLSSIASKLGLYMYVDFSSSNPAIVFESATKIAQKEIIDYTNSLDKDILSASYTETGLVEKKIISFTSDVDIDQGGSGGTYYEFDTDTRKKNFYKINFGSVFTIEGDERAELMQACFLYWLHGVLDADLYERMLYLVAFIKGTNFGVIDSNPSFKSYRQAVPQQHKFKNYSSYDWGDITTSAGSSVEEADIEPALEFLNVITGFFEATNAGSIYITNPVSEYSAVRMSFSGNVIGPFSGDTKLDAIPELKPIQDGITMLSGAGNHTVKNLHDNSGGNVGGQPINDHFFISLPDHPPVGDQDKVEASAKMFSADNFVKIFGHLSTGSYVAINKRGVLSNAIAASVALFVEAYKTVINNPIRVGYVKSKNPVTEDDDGDDDDDGGGGGGGGGEDNDETLRSLSKKTISLLAPDTISDLNPLSLTTHSGTNKEIQRLKAAATLSDVIENPKTSNVTRAGIKIPDPSPTLSSISISKDSSGIKTTTTESTAKLLPIDSGVIAANKYGDVASITPQLRPLSASQRNSLNV